jgi:hypothetical protein
VSQGVPPAGLCNVCRHQQVVRNTRGSVFSLCRRSKTEPERFPRYPRVPVVRCEGWEPGSGGSGGSEASGAEDDSDQ